MEKADPIVSSAVTTRTGPANLCLRYLLTRENGVINFVLQLFDEIDRRE